jgi:hypothetical protein
MDREREREIEIERDDKSKHGYSAKAVSESFEELDGLIW